LFLFSLLFFASCTNDNPVDNNDNGTYFPLKTGNWWKYAVTGTGMPAQITYTVKGDTTIGGKVWKALKNDYNDGIVWHRFEGTLCYMRTPISSGEMEIKLYDDKGKVGDSLVNDFSFTVGTETMNYRAVSKIVSKGDSRTVQGKNYTNVLKIAMTLYIVNKDNSLNVFMEETDYLAWNIGPIDIEVPDFIKKELLDHKVTL
jgi:hypothetical protein